MQTMFIQNKYTDTYFKILHNAKTKIYTERTETHHIIPRCLGGTDEDSNLIKLSLREHYIAHLILIRMVIGNSNKAKLVHALIMMSKTREDFTRFNSSLYELTKERYMSKGSRIYFYNKQTDKQ